jgi:hypothetical protein
MSGISILDAALDDGSTGETRYERDLPLCCRGEATLLAHANATDAGDGLGVADHFECPACGLAWQRPLPVEPELDAFGYRDTEEREEAA